MEKIFIKKCTKLGLIDGIECKVDNHPLIC